MECRKRLFWAVVAMRALFIVVLTLGLSCRASFENSVRTHKEGENHGDAWAQFELGLEYEYRDPPNYREAAKWFRKAAENGSVAAQISLGGLYAEGKGVPKNYAEAKKWFRKAAEQGETMNQFTLAEMYSAGKSVPRDYAEAARFYQMAAENG